MDSRVQRFLETNLGRYLDNVIYLAIRVLIIFGLFTLFVASMLVEFYMWGGRTGSMYWDAVGVRIYPGFFEARNFAISLLIIASLLYPVRIWFDNLASTKQSKRTRDYHLYAGLLLPSVVTFGQVSGSFYPTNPFISGPFDFTLTGIASPLYNFVFTGDYYINASIILAGLPSPLLVLGDIFFILGIIQILALKAYEKKQINLGLFLVPVLANVTFSILLFGSSFPSLSFNGYIWREFPHFAEVCYAIPVLTIGVLVKAIGIQKDSRK